MKPVSLEFCGINSFSETQKINFEELLQYGIFGIFGDTGSGKSTILDCIGFSLYGDVTRSRSGKISDIINYDKDSLISNSRSTMQASAAAIVWSASSNAKMLRRA